MKSFKFAALSFAVLALSACADKASVRGVLTGAPDSRIVAMKLGTPSLELIDTVKTGKDGSFHFDVAVPKGQPQFVYIYRNGTKIASLLLERGEKAVVAADTLGSFTVTGSEGSSMLKEVEDRYASFTGALSSMTDAAEVRKAYVDYYRESVRYVIANPFSMTIIPVLGQKVGDFPVFSQLTDALHFRSACDSLKMAYPESEYVKALEKETRAREQRMALDSKLRTAKVSSFPDIELPDIKGKTVVLSEVPSKAILLHFWDPADPAQKMMNKELLLPVYESFHSKGFEIYSVGIDADKPNWAGVVSSQNLPWINVVDTKAQYSPYLGLYGVVALPTTILIVDGEIQTAEIKGEEGLKKKLATLLK